MRSGGIGPGLPMGAVTQHKTRFAGEAAAAKIARVREALKRNDGLLVSDPHNLAWLFNIRGADVSHTPAAAGIRLCSARRPAGPADRFGEARGVPPATDSPKSPTSPSRRAGRVSWSGSEKGARASCSTARPRRPC